MKVDFGLELNPLDRRYIETIRQWRNTYAIWRWCRQNDVISDTAQEGWFERQAADPTIKMYMIMRRVDGAKVPVGVCGLTSLDWFNRRAEFSLYTAPEHQRKGYGRQALSLLMAHGFQNLALEQIWGESIDQNPAIKVFESLGFKKDGTRRAYYWKDGALHDAHLYSILRSEWLSSLSPPPPLRPQSSETSSLAPSSPPEDPVGQVKPDHALPRLSDLRKRRGSRSPSPTSSSGRGNKTGDDVLE